MVQTTVPRLTRVCFLGGGGGGQGGNFPPPPPESGLAPPEMGCDHFNTGQSQYKASPPQF